MHRRAPRVRVAGERIAAVQIERTRRQRREPSVAAPPRDGVDRDEAGAEPIALAATQRAPRLMQEAARGGDARRFEPIDLLDRSRDVGCARPDVRAIDPARRGGVEQHPSCGFEEHAAPAEQLRLVACGLEHEVDSDQRARLDRRRRHEQERIAVRDRAWRWRLLTLLADPADEREAAPEPRRVAERRPAMHHTGSLDALQVLFELVARTLEQALALGGFRSDQRRERGARQARLPSERSQERAGEPAERVPHRVGREHQALDPRREPLEAPHRVTDRASASTAPPPASGAAGGSARGSVRRALRRASSARGPPAARRGSRGRRAAPRDRSARAPPRRS